MIDNSSSGIYNAKGQYRCTSLQPKFIVWENIQHDIDGYMAEQLLKERFHLTNGFHPGQREIIEQLVQSQRVLAIQGTGWG